MVDAVVGLVVVVGEQEGLAVGEELGYALAVAAVANSEVDLALDTEGFARQLRAVLGVKEVFVGVERGCTSVEMMVVQVVMQSSANDALVVVKAGLHYYLHSRNLRSRHLIQSMEALVVRNSSLAVKDIADLTLNVEVAVKEPFDMSRLVIAVLEGLHRCRIQGLDRVVRAVAAVDSAVGIAVAAVGVAVAVVVRVAVGVVVGIDPGYWCKAEVEPTLVCHTGHMIVAVPAGDHLHSTIGVLHRRLMGQRFLCSSSLLFVHQVHWIGYLDKGLKRVVVWVQGVHT